MGKLLFHFSQNDLFVQYRIQGVAQLYVSLKILTTCIGNRYRYIEYFFMFSGKQVRLEFQRTEQCSLETNLRFRGCEVKYWNLPFTVEDFHEFQKVRCIGSETVLANPVKLFIFAIYNTLSCQIFDIVITLVVDETHQSGKDKLLSGTAPKFI